MSSTAAIFAFLNALNALQGLALSALLAFIAATLVNLFSGIDYPPNLPLIREQKGKTSFSFRTRLAYYNDAKALFCEIYTKYSKLDKTCLMPGLGPRKEVILPTSALRWLISQPESILSSQTAMLEINQFEWSAGHRKYGTDGWPGTVLKQDMNPNLDLIAPEMYDEVKYAFDEKFGMDRGEWREIELVGTMKRVVAQISGRFTVGKPLCRDEKYLSYIITYADLFVMNAGCLGILPKFLRPVFGPLTTLPIRYYIFKIKQRFRPIFEQRLALLNSTTSNNNNNATPSPNPEPLDHLQKMLHHASKHHPSELNLHEISICTSISHFGATHQTSISMTNVLFNIISSNAQHNTISILRQEIAHFKKEGGGVWSKITIAKMVKMDSVIRETLRLHSFGNRNVFKQVMVSNLRTPDGILLPLGSMLSVLAYPSHIDADYFDDPLSFDPFRFSRLREKGQEGSGLGLGLGFVSTGERNLTFGHGRHACPGRFVMDFMAKMMLVYVLGEYEVGFGVGNGEGDEGKRPQTRWVSEAQMLPGKGVIFVRRRGNEEDE